MKLALLQIDSSNLNTVVIPLRVICLINFHIIGRSRVVPTVSRYPVRLAAQKFKSISTSNNDDQRSLNAHTSNLSPTWIADDWCTRNSDFACIEHDSHCIIIHRRNHEVILWIRIVNCRNRSLIMHAYAATKLSYWYDHGAMDSSTIHIRSDQVWLHTLIARLMRGNSKIVIVMCYDKGRGFGSLIVGFDWLTTPVSLHQSASAHITINRW